MAEPNKPGIFSRAAKFAVEGLFPDWFGPNEPLKPSAPEAAVEGRQFDYGVGANMQITPKEETTAIRAVTFPNLRWLADSTEVLRAVIETRKDKISGLEWDFRVIGASAADSRKDPRVIWLKKFYRRPDGRLTFPAWIRQIEEDLIVLDAPAIHVRRDKQGRILAFEQIDGATIKPLMDHLGRIPEAPNAAFQQTLKGLPAIYYSTDDLQYRPRNPRIHSMYGYGPVEQILIYCNMAVRRQMQQLGYFTEGNMPEGFIPVQGTAQQVEMFQRIWDAGEINGVKRGKVRFVPADSATKFVPFKDPILADAFDEWMARIACYVMSEDPTPFLKSVNRATAESSRDGARSDGLDIQKQWVKSILDEQIQDYLGFEDIEAFSVPAKEADPAKITARVTALYEKGIMRLDEARDAEGLEGEGPQPAAPVAPPAPEAPAQVEHLHRSAQVDPIHAVKLSRQLAEMQASGISDPAYAWFQQAAERGALAIASHTPEAKREDLAEWAWIADIDLDEVSLLDAFTPTLSRIWGESASIALGSTGSAVKVGFMAESAAYARTRSAWLVGMHIDPTTGEAIPAIRPEYRISDMCREQIRKTAEQAGIENWTNEKIATELREAHAFSRARALNIAGTEIVNADEAGKMEGWKATGRPMVKKSILASNENHGPDDLANAAQGWIPVEQAFQSGHMHPTYHPNCRCTSIARSAENA